MGAPNLFVPLDQNLCSRKVSHLFDHFHSQVSKAWFKEDLFSGLLRLRGHGVPIADVLRRGLLLPQGRPRLTVTANLQGESG